MTVQKFKYGRTPHFPWSPGITNDDRVMKLNDISQNFSGKKLAVTLKMDGECTSAYTSDGYSHARSIDSEHDESKSFFKRFWAERFFLTDRVLRVNGENLFAKHSIHYKNLDSFFYSFSIFDENNRRLDWVDFTKTCETLNILHVPVLKIITASDDGEWMKDVKSIFEDVVSKGEEGVVVTTLDGYHYDDFPKNIIKAVRENHVKTDKHWKKSKIIPNEIRDTANNKYI